MSHPNLHENSLRENQLQSLNGQLSQMLTDNGEKQTKRSQFRNKALNSIQNKINSAIRKSQDVQPREVPKDIAAIQEIKPPKIIQQPKIQEYSPVPEPAPQRKLSVFQDKSFKINGNFMEPQKNHLQPFQRSKFNVRYNRPTIKGVEEQVYSLGSNKPVEAQSYVRNPSPIINEKKI